MAIKLAIIGEFNPNSEAYWIDTQDITNDTFSRFDGFLISPGGPYNNIDNVLDVIRYARDQFIYKYF